MPVFGYARVSSQDQDLSAQEAELVAAGAVKVYREKVSGAKANRAELMKVVNKLEPGDVLIVTRLDRLARSTRDLLNLLATISERGASFRSLRDAWADTTNAQLTPHQRQEARARLEAGETQSDIARSYNVDATTIGRLA